jgi:hypothetical protein
MRQGIDDLQGDQPFGQQPQRPACVTLGRGAACQRDQAGLLLPIELAAILECGRFAVQGGVQPGGGVLLAHPGYGRGVDLQCYGDRSVGPAGAGLALVGLEQDAGMGQRAGRGAALTVRVCSRARWASDKITVYRLRMLGLLQACRCPGAASVILLSLRSGQASRHVLADDSWLDQAAGVNDDDFLESATEAASVLDAISLRRCDIDVGAAATLTDSQVARICATSRRQLRSIVGCSCQR